MLMRLTRSLPATALPFLAALAAAACSSASSDGGSPGANAGGSANGGQGGGGGQVGAGGAQGGAGSCTAPSDPSKGALCITFAPEAMNFIATEPQLDGKGQLVVEVFDAAAVGGDAGATAAALQVQRFPTDPNATISLTALPAVRFDGLPPNVFVRTTFVDNPLVASTGSVLWGAWFGGIKLDQGILSVVDQHFDAVQAPAGTGTAITQPLTAVRYLQLDVTLAAGVTPLDDGQGPLSLAAWSGATPGATTQLTGMSAESPCAKLVGGRQTLGALMLGAGPHYVIAELDDYNLGGDPTPGSILSASTDVGGLTIADASKLTFAAGEYAHSAALELSRVVPLGSGTAPAHYACP